MNGRIQICLLCIAFGVVSLIRITPVEAQTTRNDDSHWGDAVDGLRISLDIQGRDTFDYHPGEPIRCSARMKNFGDHAALVQADGALTPYSALHVRIPDDRELIELPIEHQFAERPPGTNMLRSLEPRIWFSIGDSSIRLSDPMLGYIDAATKKPVTDVSFRKPGKYEFWFVYAVPAGTYNAWSGTLASNHISIAVSELPVEKRVLTPTPAQIEMVRQYIQNGDTPSDQQKNPMAARRAADDLGQAIVETENEGMALHLIELMKTDPAHADWYQHLIQSRYAGTADSRFGFVQVKSGIDGPYLAKYAECCVEQMETGSPQLVAGFGGRNLYRYTDMSGILAYLHFHPESSKLKDRVISLAKQSANVSKWPSANTLPVPSTMPTYPPCMGLPTAWKILIDANVLHDEMSVDEATAILGPPSPVNHAFGGGGGPQVAATHGQTWMVWFYVRNPGMENPGYEQLAATLKDGKLSQFHQ